MLLVFNILNITHTKTIFVENSPQFKKNRIPSCILAVLVYSLYIHIEWNFTSSADKQPRKLAVVFRESLLIDSRRRRLWLYTTRTYLKFKPKHAPPRLISREYYCIITRVYITKNRYQTSERLRRVWNLYTLWCECAEFVFHCKWFLLIPFRIEVFIKKNAKIMFQKISIPYFFP